MIYLGYFIVFLDFNEPLEPNNPSQDQEAPSPASNDNEVFMRTFSCSHLILSHKFIEFVFLIFLFYLIRVIKSFTYL